MQWRKGRLGSAGSVKKKGALHKGASEDLGPAHVKKRRREKTSKKEWRKNVNV